MVYDDVSKAIRVCSGEEDETFSKIYFSSNEYLKKLYKCFSLENKEVLSVLASSDQMFYAYMGGARKVDTFDVNSLTKYYYYLRRWSIIYDKKYYFSKDIFRSHNHLFKLLDKVKCSDKNEEDALSFWKCYLSNITPKNHQYLYSISGNSNNIIKLKSLRDRLINEKLTFYHMNLFDEINCDKKYDVIITSNILEYGLNPMNLEKGRDNLKKLLKDGGQIIGSHYVFSPNSPKFEEELKIFEKDFSYHELHDYYEPLLMKKYPLGYVYTKK